MTQQAFDRYVQLIQRDVSDFIGTYKNSKGRFPRLATVQKDIRDSLACRTGFNFSAASKPQQNAIMAMTEYAFYNDRVNRTGN